MPSTTIEAPTPSAQETEIYDQILSQINQYNEYNQMMMPLQMEQAGYIQTYNDPKQQAVVNAYRELDALRQYSGMDVNTPEGRQYYDAVNNVQNALEEIYGKGQVYRSDVEGNYYRDKISEWESGWRKMTEDERKASMTPEELSAYNLQMAQNERSLAAIEGRLDPSQATLDQMQKEWEGLKETYGSIQGDSWETATATDTVGQQNLDKFKNRWTTYLDAVRHGEAGSDIQSAVLASGLTTGQTQNKIGTTQAIGSNLAGGIPLYGSVLNPIQGYNMAGYQAQAANQASQASQFGSVLNLAGMLGAGYLVSSKDYKTDIKSKTKADEDKALKSILGTKSKSYRYKPEMKMGDMIHLGTIAEESPKEFSTGKMINLGDKVELLSMAVKSLARKRRIA